MLSTLEKLKAQQGQLMRDAVGDPKAKNYLAVVRVVVGELEGMPSRQSKPRQPTDEDAWAFMRKVYLGNKGTLELMKIQGRDDLITETKLKDEIELLAQYVGHPLTPELLKTMAGAQADQLKAAKNDDMAVGLVIKELRKTDEFYDSEDVRRAVREIRA